MSKEKTFYIKATIQNYDKDGYPKTTSSGNYFIKDNDLDTKEGLDDCVRWLKDYKGADTVCIDFIWRLK